MPAEGISAAAFEGYLQHLRWLVDEPSQFTEPEDVARLMEKVHAKLENFLPRFVCSQDAAGNLRCVPKDLVATDPLLFLSAHVDTVPSDPTLWSAPFRPRPHWENDSEIVAQGINDCKAGVATQLWLAEKFGQVSALRNVIFTLTFKEEGAGRKTGVTLGAEIGKSLPAPARGSTLLVMENTVDVVRGMPLVYASEASSYTVRITGSIRELQERLDHLSAWRPVAIIPSGSSAAMVFTDYKPLGHVCTAPPAENPLLLALRASGANAILSAGDERSLGTVPSRIGRAESFPNNLEHRLTITKRGNYTLEDTRRELDGIEYEPVKPLETSTGFDAEPRREESRAGRAFLEASRRREVEFAQNPGSSDATIITSSMPAEFKANLLPLVCGPGSRAQRGAHPPRFTHGPNETFVKNPGKVALELITRVMSESGHLQALGG